MIFENDKKYLRSFLPLFAGGFTPFQIASLVNAFEGENIVQNPLSGAVKFPDSKDSADLHVSTCSPPAPCQPSNATINGVPVILHNGANTDLLTLQPDPIANRILIGATSFSFTGFCKTLSQSVDRQVLFSFSTVSPPANDWFAVVQDNGTKNLKIWCRENGGQTVNITAANDCTLGVAYVFTFDNIAHESRLYLNGGLSYVNNNPSFPAYGMDTKILQVELHYNNQTGSKNWDGYMGDHYMFNESLSLANVNNMGNFLSDKFGLTWTNF